MKLKISLHIFSVRWRCTQCTFRWFCKCHARRLIHQLYFFICFAFKLNLNEILDETIWKMKLWYFNSKQMYSITCTILYLAHKCFWNGRVTNFRVQTYHILIRLDKCYVVVQSNRISTASANDFGRSYKPITPQKHCSKAQKMTSFWLILVVVRVFFRLSLWICGKLFVFVLVWHVQTIFSKWF